MQFTSKTLLGPLQSEGLESDKDFIRNYVPMNGTKSIYDDSLITSIISGEKNIFSGVRGSGKTMIMKTGEMVLESEIKKGEGKKILPCYISFSGFRNDVTMQDEAELSNDELKVVKEIFRGFFYISLLDNILVKIENLELSKDVPFNFFGIKTEVGVKREIKKALHELKQVGFAELTQLKQSENKNSAGINVLDGIFDFKSSNELKRQTTKKSVTMDDLQKTVLFKNTIESICEVYGIDRIHFMFDEVFTLKYLQAEFFNILFGFRNFKYCSFTISAYPTLMDYGTEFDIPDDANVTTVAPILYKPNKKQFEKPLFDFVGKRLEVYGNKELSEVIFDDALQDLILYTNGNPRILLHSIQHIWDEKKGKINISSITNDIVNQIANTIYIDFLNKQAIRYKLSMDKINGFLDVIIERLRRMNSRGVHPTVFFLIDSSIEYHFSRTIDLLQYCRIIDHYKVGDFGGSTSKKGKVFLLNPLFARYHGVFTRDQLKQLPNLIKNAINKDRKIQFASLDSFLVQIGDAINSCPILAKGQCESVDCGEAFNESWRKCPFHDHDLTVGVIEEEKKEKPSISIECLPISYKLRNRLHEIDVKNVFDVTDCGIDGLQQASYIGRIRAKMIYYYAIEYIDDFL
ncbi:MAG: hypothetical protein ACOWWH_11490 [Eubacteriaceae bacterium]